MFKKPRPTFPQIGTDIKRQNRPAGTITNADKRDINAIIRGINYQAPPPGPKTVTRPRQTAKELFKLLRFGISKKIGQGQSGTVYRVSRGLAFVRYIQAIVKSQTRYKNLIADHSDRLRRNTPVMVKILEPYQVTYWKTFEKIAGPLGTSPKRTLAMRSSKEKIEWNRKRLVKEYLNEIRVLNHIAQSKPTKLRNGRVFDAKAHAPTLYYAAYLETLDVFVIIESVAPGKPIWKKDTRQPSSATGMAFRRLPAKAIAAIEKALLSLWSIGIVHRDLTPGNILYDSWRNKATIIDFASAIQFVPGTVPQTAVQQLLENTAYINLTGVDAIKRFYNPLNPGALQSLKREHEFVPGMYHNANLWQHHITKTYYGKPKNLEKRRREAWARPPPRKRGIFSFLG